MSQLSPGVFVSSVGPAGNEAGAWALPLGAVPHSRAAQAPGWPPACRFEVRERNHLLLARGVGPGLVELLEAAGLSSLDTLRRAGTDAVMVQLTQRFGERMRGYSRRALGRALASFACSEAASPTLSTGAAATGAPRQARPLMVDIARAAGVAPSTVSRALNDSDHISPQTKERIRELARSASYSRNAIAQSLRCRRARTIALLVPDPSSGDCSLGEAQGLALISSLTDALDEAGFQLSCVRPRADRLAHVRETVGSGLAVGIVVLGPWPDAPADLPVVLWGPPQPGSPCPTVHVDAGAGTRLATRLLLGQGSRRLVFLPDRHAPDLLAQRRGFVQAHQELGLEPAVAAAGCGPLADDAANLCALSLEPGHWPDGVVAASDWCALAALQALRSSGLRVPEDVPVVGFGDTPLAAQGALGLSTVRWPVQQAGRALAKLLLERIAGRRPESVVLTPRLVIRASTRPRASLA